eukprot:3293049-Pleurochrysis_carterae.AAC.2
MSDSSAAEPPTISRLRLLSDQPVEGCELTPDVFLSNGISANMARLEYRWYRSTDKMACSWCCKTPVVMQRLTDNTYYCSITCFSVAWPGHPAQHRTGLTNRGPRTDNGKDMKGLLGLEAPETTEQKWVEVADTISYTPSMDDVGHMLKLVTTTIFRMRNQLK